MANFKKHVNMNIIDQLSEYYKILNLLERTEIINSVFPACPATGVAAGRSVYSVSSFNGIGVNSFISS